MKLKVIILGGAGFIGSNLAFELQEQYELFIIDNFSSGKKSNLKDIRATVIKADLTDSKETFQIFQKIQPEIVFHLAALPRIQLSLDSPVETFKANVLITQNVLEASRQTKVKRFIYSSSSSVYGDQKIPLVESMIPNPISLYATQKYFSEILCQKYQEFYGLKIICLRYFNVYGNNMDDEGAYKLVIPIWLKQARENKPLTIYGEGEQTRDFTYIKDVVRANILAVNGKPGVYNIGSGKEISMTRLAKLFSSQIKYVKNPRPYEEKRKCADILKAKIGLRWQPMYDIESGLKDAGLIK